MTSVHHLGRPVLASHATAAVLVAITSSGGPDTGQLPLAIGVYLLTTVVLAIGERQHHPHGCRPRTWPAHLVEAITAGLGLGAAFALATRPVLVLLLTPPLLLLHHGVLRPTSTSTDGKTGLLTATAWTHSAQQELSRAARHPDATLGVLMIDLDRFKQINDTYGHLTGDSVLRAAADAITHAVRDYDLVGRFGGDEFLVLLPDTTPAATDEVAARIRAAITNLHVPTPWRTGPGTFTGPVTITGLGASIGIAIYPTDSDTLDTLLQHADSALYMAKHRSRGQRLMS